jgi:hypothetical protein
MTQQYVMVTVTARLLIPVTAKPGGQGQIARVKYIVMAQYGMMLMFVMAMGPVRLRIIATVTMDGQGHFVRI